MPGPNSIPGPYVQLAAFCESVLQESGGVLSLLRVIDRVNVRLTNPDAPDELPAGQLETTLVVALKAGDARGRVPITIGMEKPDGTSPVPQRLEVLFEGEERGVNLILRMQLEALEGLYWFDVTVGERSLTRVPLRLTYQRIPPAARMSG